MSSHYRSIKSAERTLALVELYARHELGLGVGEVADLLDMPQASASMLLRNLKELGFLRYENVGRRYVPTLRMMLLGGGGSYRIPQFSTLIDRLHALREECACERAFISMQNGAAIQHILMLVGDHRTDGGGARSLIATASGRMLLSTKKDAEIATWVRRSEAECATRRRISSVRLGDFLRGISEIRRLGYAVNAGDTDPELGAVTVVLDSIPGHDPIVLGLASRIDTMRRRETLIADRLRHIQDGIAA